MTQISKATPVGSTRPERWVKKSVRIWITVEPTLLKRADAHVERIGPDAGGVDPIAGAGALAKR